MSSMKLKLIIFFGHGIHYQQIIARECPSSKVDDWVMISLSRINKMSVSVLQCHNCVMMTDPFVQWLFLFCYITIY